MTSHCMKSDNATGTECTVIWPPKKFPAFVLHLCLATMPKDMHDLGMRSTTSTMSSHGNSIEAYAEATFAPCITLSLNGCIRKGNSSGKADPLCISDIDDESNAIAHHSGQTVLEYTTSTCRIWYLLAGRVSARLLHADNTLSRQSSPKAWLCNDVRASDGRRTARGQDPPAPIKPRCHRL